MDRTLNLSGLHDLLHNTLLITQKVKEILKKDCDEAAFVLKPWQIKTIVEKRIDESICNCKKIKDEAEEVAAEISRAIVLAQELREKLKINVAPKKISRKSAIENIYLSNSASTSDYKKVSKTNTIIQNSNALKSSDCKNSNAFQNEKVTSVLMKKSTDDTKKNNGLDKMQSKISSAKKSNKKNFILENKLNVKKISSINKLQVTNNNSPNIPQNLRKSSSSETTSTQLSNLIHKMTRQSTENVLISSKSMKNDCPLHGNNACQLIQEQIIAVDIVEALRNFNIPNDIIKVLRAYHTFLKTKAGNSIDIKENRCKKSIGTFLKEFEAMNVTVQDHLLEPYLFNKTAKSITVFGSIFNESSDSIHFNDTKVTSIETRTSKQYDVQDIDQIIKNPFSNFSLTRGWLSNGVWNISCMEYFKNFSKGYNIRYCNKKQLLALHEAIQKLQRIQYLNIFIQTILHDVISNIKSVEPASMEYMQAYKTLFILYQGLNPKVPVLVKTDS